MRVAVMGLGYVGLVAATELARAGHRVAGVEQDLERMILLRNGVWPDGEPGLRESIEGLPDQARPSFHPSLEQVRGPLEAAVIAVGTPAGRDGAADLSQVTTAFRQVAALDPRPDLIVVKSTIPPGTSCALAHGADAPAGLADRYVHSPEFLSQGSALRDWRMPARVVAGMWNRELLGPMRALLRGVRAPWVTTGPVDAEMIKYASNAFLATKISFANELAALCDRAGADIDQVLSGVRLDPRMGRGFWRPGLGFGDTCLPKDLEILLHQATELGVSVPLLTAVRQVNVEQRLRPLRAVREALRSVDPETAAVAVLGLAYEPATGDLRDAPSRFLIPEVRRLCPRMRVWDPQLTPGEIEVRFPGVTRWDSPEEAARGASIILVLTEYPQLAEVDWAQVRANAGTAAMVVDAKNCLTPSTVADAGLAYRGVGRPGAEQGGRPCRTCS